MPTGDDELEILRRELERTRAELERTRAELGRAYTALDDCQRSCGDDRRAARLETLGQLAAGVAHEINTPMQFISDNIHFLREGYSAWMPLLDRLRAIRDLARAGAVDGTLIDEADRAEVDAELDYPQDRLAPAFEATLDGVARVSEIVAAMKVFAQTGDDLADVDLHQVLATALTVARTEYRAVAEVVTELGPIPRVPGHAADLNQLFLELVLNAAHAIVATDAPRAGRRGTISVRTRAEPTAVVVEIGDTGCGMAPEQLARVFERSAPDGHGLATALGVVERHRGELDVDSRPGEGTTVRIRLPVAGPEISRRIRRLSAVPM